MSTNLLLGYTDNEYGIYILLNIKIESGNTRKYTTIWEEACIGMLCKTSMSDVSIPVHNIYLIQ